MYVKDLYLLDVAQVGFPELVKFSIFFSLILLTIIKITKSGHLHGSVT